MATRRGDEIVEDEELSNIEEGGANSPFPSLLGCCTSSTVVTTSQKLLAELVGTYFVIFAGCGAVAVNKIYGSVTFPGICIAWGLIVMVMIYTVGHISGAHFNPAVTITLTLFGRFPLWQVFPYFASQLLGSILASATLTGILDVSPKDYFGTVPVGSYGQSLMMEMVITFLLMFVICGSTTDKRAVNELGGVAVGMTILLNVLVAGPVSGASMNPARSLGPAIVMHNYQDIWVYIVGPVVGAVLGSAVYSLTRHTDKPLREITKANSFLKKMSRNNSP